MTRLDVARRSPGRAAPASRVAMLVALVGAPLVMSACSTEEGVDAVAKAQRSSDAQTLGIFSPDLSEDMREQTLDTLKRDAFRREQRFLDAAIPGRMFRSTRIPEAEIEGGLWSPRELYQIGA